MSATSMIRSGSMARLKRMLSGHRRHPDVAHAAAL